MFLQLLSLLSVTCVTDKKKKKKGRAVAGTEEKINLHTYKKKREKKIERDRMCCAPTVFH